ncbi:hypothetical protein [Pseudoduganella buxea]|uniref:Uncharacterized protein n=1 Tax=Pseudoduganella buxea TaxID=1949069 RepID=A0A6I3SW41_9BURK|nr:hypothetical protein [Pseudoduganella buxea]MTV53413.1 hypothetical protein [Pseudoduganella buxea]GGC19832.1 hypothetical protein GCM10011572_46540 [Pseudoduganella buxea]
MDAEEEIACQFLVSQNLGGVKYEPEGYKTFPDFSLGGQAVGVEVRRLNQHYTQRNREQVGFEKAEFEILPPLYTMLREFGPSVDGECWHVTIDYRRPITWKRLRNRVRTALQTFKAQAARTDTILAISETLGIELSRSTKDHGVYFFPWVIADGNVGGNAAALVMENLRTCIEAKKSKVVPPIRNKYNAWWLVLVNNIDKNMESDFYQDTGRNFDPPLAHPFDRLIIVDYRNHLNWIEL